MESPTVERDPVEKEDDAQPEVERESEEPEPEEPEQRHDEPREEATRDDPRMSGEDTGRPDDGRERSSSPEPREPESVSARDADGLVSRAREQLKALRGVDAESVSSLQHGFEGWTVTLEVVEVTRIPSSTDVLASYEVVLDDDGDLVRFERVNRYYRGQTARDGA